MEPLGMDPPLGTIIVRGAVARSSLQTTPQTRLALVPPCPYKQSRAVLLGPLIGPHLRPASAFEPQLRTPLTYHEAPGQSRTPSESNAAGVTGDECRPTSAMMRLLRNQSAAISALNGPQAFAIGIAQVPSDVWTRGSTCRRVASIDEDEFRYLPSTPEMGRRGRRTVFSSPGKPTKCDGVGRYPARPASLCCRSGYCPF